VSLETYGDYQLVKKLATGGMASIYLARQKGFEGFEKLLVVKRILPHLAENDEFIKMFLDEARIAARLNHPNIVQIFNLGALQDSYFIAMEYIHGDDMRRVWKRSDQLGKPIPIPLVCRIIMDAAAGLDYAHARTDSSGKPLGIVHRDISPQNILVSFEGGVKVVDFGIAKAADQATVTKSGVLKGKYSYMSPEQASGAKIDHKSDIFALGIVLYELLTATRLFKRPSDLKTLSAVTECDIAPPSAVNARIPKDLDPVVMKALTRSRDERYASAGAMHAAIEAWLVHNRLLSSSVHLAAFMKGLYADRLEREAQEGRVLVEEVDPSRNPEDVAPPPPPKAVATRSSAPQKATPSARPESPAARGVSREDDPEATRADRSSSLSGDRVESQERRATPVKIERDRITGRTESMATITEADAQPPAKRAPYVLAAVLGVIGASVGAWLAIGSSTGGVVRLVSDPPGALVVIDGTALPDLVTPCTLPKLPAGKHGLQLALRGYKRLDAEITVLDRDERTLPPFFLEPLPPLKPAAPPLPEPVKSVTVRVKSSPAGADAWVDGQELGPTPVSVELPPGKSVALKLELAGYKELETTIKVPQAGGEEWFSLDEKPAAKKKTDKPTKGRAEPASREAGGVTPL
jgi:serine/threonine protein kinase